MRHKPVIKLHTFLPPPPPERVKDKFTEMFTLDKDKTPHMWTPRQEWGEATEKQQESEGRSVRAVVVYEELPSWT